jgi:hypothetical protein
VPLNGESILFVPLCILKAAGSLPSPIYPARVNELFEGLIVTPSTVLTEEVMVPVPVPFFKRIGTFSLLLLSTYLTFSSGVLVNT